VVMRIANDLCRRLVWLATGKHEATIVLSLQIADATAG
jgi:hypothetical protein